MEQLNISTQTLREFLDRPFNQPNKQKHLAYESRYQSYKKSNKIKIVRSLEFENNYFLHISVPSESQKGQLTYDVVIQFFTPRKEVQRELTLEHYYVQFFSNSPGFMYKYAALYKIEGYLIEAFYDKFMPGTLDTLPDKANKDYELFYDSSIYYAARYLLDNRFRTMGKFNLKIFSTKNFQLFYDAIQDIESIGISRDVVTLERQLKKEISKDTKLSQTEELKLKTSKNKLYGKQMANKIVASKSTSADSDGIKKKKGIKTTSRTTVTKVVGGSKKIVAKKTTRKS